jgi:hypothetical protein
VTLIHGNKTLDGWVISVDSQETVGAYRVSRLKITPWGAGNFQIAMAGSGNNGELIDAFEERLKQALQASQIESLEELRKLIHLELLDFQKNEAASYPRREQQMRFMIGAMSISQSKSAVWSTRASQLIPVTRYDLVGFEDERYKFAAEAYLRAAGEITTAQGIFLGLYIMWLAEQTSNFVKAPISVVVVRDGGLFSERQEVVDALLERVKLFTAQFDLLFLACPDTSLQHGEFADKLNEFIRSVVHLRQEYVEEMVGKKIEEGLDKVNDPYTLIPAALLP